MFARIQGPGKHIKSRNRKRGYLREIKMERKVIAVDLDGTLTDGTDRWWKNEPMIRNEKVIAWVDGMYKKGHIIIIHTARPWHTVKRVVAWLTENEIRYHGLNFVKMSADIYLDDKALNVKDIPEVKK